MTGVIRLVDAETEDTRVFALFAAVRSEELGMDAWDPSLRESILHQQYAAHRAFRLSQGPAPIQLILLDEDPVGFAVLDRQRRAWHCLDIAIVARARRRGVATQVFRQWQREAAAEGRPITLQVLRTNDSARTLYDRLGFRVVGETDTHYEMEWRP